MDFHVCVIDGLSSEDPDRGLVQFHEAADLTASEWNQLQHTVRRRVLRYFHRVPTDGGRGLLERQGLQSGAGVQEGERK